MKKATFIISSLLFLAWGCGSNQHEQTALQVMSPEKKLIVNFYLTKEGAPGYQALFNNKVVIDSSKLGFTINNTTSLEKGFDILNSTVTTVDTTWEQPWGEERRIRDNHTQLKVELKEHDGLKRKLNIIFRAFDYGLGFRYEFPEQENLKDFEIMDELTEFNMAGDHTSWWIPAFAGNRYEFLYSKSLTSKIDRVHTPVTFETSDSIYLSIHEAALQNFPSMVIQNEGQTKLKCFLVPYSKTNPVKAKVTAPSHTPWRTIQMATNPGDLITSYLILNLNEPNKLGDVSWVQPGKYVGVWWEMHVNKGTWNQGPKHSANTKNTKRYIDFAAKHGFKGVLVEGWNVGWDGQWMNSGKDFKFDQPYPDYDADALSNYAKEKGVYIIGHHETGAGIENYEAQLEKAYQFLEDHGMRVVKTGYVEHGDTLTNGLYHHGQYYVNHFQKVHETAARHHVTVVAHEPIKDTGMRRTYPNMASREAARGQEYNAWSEDGGNPPNHVTILPFTRLLGGPMDYTPGVFDIKLPTQPNNQINGTLVKELALYVIIYAPYQMACDLPENYEGNPAFKFIKDVPTDWETTKVLEASIGNYVTIARQERGKDNWFVGTITNENPRSTSLKLNFLTPGKTYTATVYKDAADAHYINNPTAFLIESKEVTSETVLDLSLAASGGAAISLLEKK
jgi:alpha-glucosidase